ncbi:MULTISPECIES: L-threonine dehydrogenase [Vibrio]|jgi:alcohol dehydrogenase|uniref:L-threonine dehydrogenase n=1 Tax=Vibrio natriegens NBRC 15636 = ATCC 14048 = DSM 759 TaxID=1219067 RepID=A0AAN0Y5P2_VIBNA|nr:MULTISPECIES: L-threonine dehydrogenase [Vibrio]MEE3877142.1 L-threonine dehydrogenase [Vibrio sp. YYF0003]WMN89929.1 L-threonine dehydrogenase [Vibrio parahaemolyticus]CAH0529943.1 Alcohol dehydrogenase 2 [Catenococcus thiocycli]AEX24780.1 alcohol dehydrogenase [Vibrio sp. EJY3]ALR18670.1 alcohol dehydrogenase [Vibrio natriegens NBRC 15636 = ATCC 14048 = DSM 759]
MTSAFFIPTVNLMGAGCLKDAADSIQSQGFKKGLIVTDKILNQIGVVEQVQGLLNERSVATVVFDGTQPNPTINNVNDGLALLKENECDFVISLGGGSPHDCAKGIALVAANGGHISDYEGVDQSAKPMLPLIAINTTAGTASEMTRFCIITDEERHIKMAIVDKHTTPLISVNDAELMLAKPASLTAATGMDALTHAIEAYVSIAATPITDAVAIKAIELIQAHLRTAVKNGENLEAREQMAYAQFMAGMAFNNASLGYVHAMAHQLGGFYDLPHGVCNAILLPHVQRYNAQVCPERLTDVAKAMGVNVEGMSAEQGAAAAIDAIVTLAKDVGIPAGIKELGAKLEDIPTLADNALKDACGFTNPKQATHEEISAIFEAAM